MADYHLFSELKSYENLSTVEDTKKEIQDSLDSIEEAAKNVNKSLILWDFEPVSKETFDILEDTHALSKKVDASTQEAKKILLELMKQSTKGVFVELTEGFNIKKAEADRMIEEAQIILNEIAHNLKKISSELHIKSGKLSHVTELISGSKNPKPVSELTMGVPWQDDELVAMLMEADLMVREVRGHMKISNKIGMAALQSMGIPLDTIETTDSDATVRRHPVWDKPPLTSQHSLGSLEDTRRKVETAYLAAVVEFLHTEAIIGAKISLKEYPPSRYTLLGVPVKIKDYNLKEFLSNLNPELSTQTIHFYCINEDSNFLSDLEKYRSHISSKPGISKRLLSDRGLLVKKGIDLALKQAEKNEFGMSA